jgi:hypothetical protein
MKPVPLTKWKRRGRSATKRLLYSQLLLRDAILVMFGRAKPLVRFTVENSPPSVYLNFAIRADQVEAFEQFIAVPMPLTPIACLDGDDPFHCLTLNMYRVSGLANGIRAEWSTYVNDAAGTPRYMVVEAQCEKGTLDSVDLFTVSGLAEYTANPTELRLRAGSAGDKEFRCTMPTPTDGPLVRSAPEWITANDYIYWRNGVCDRTFYDAGLADPRMLAIKPGDAVITDTTQWARFIEPTPRSIVVFQDSIEFAMSPWWNIDDLS